jgi:cysteine desulfurase / selenocysteine lyase
MKASPHLISDESFIDVPKRLRHLLAELIGAAADDVFLGNSASWGLQVLANGLPWREGDEVLVMADDFPATVFPWFVIRRYGARVRQLDISQPVPTPEVLERQISARTRVVCLSWVWSLTGHVIDIPALAEVCLSRRVHLVVNATQGLGALPFDVQSTSVAAVTCSGFKWLCGPYATGFAWIDPEVRESMHPTQAYWLALPDDIALDLNREGQHRQREELGARAYDVFGTANFLNFLPWSASVSYLLTETIDAIAAHDRALVGRLIDGVADTAYRVISPTDPDHRAAIVVVTAGEERANAGLHQLLAEAGVDAALRGGNLRLSPHLYNTADDIDRAVAVIRSHDRLPKHRIG